ncbi:MAG: type IA DNA topoisomerase [Lachnospiraceae bacterium]|nr:type IA DNA topoisomerase [Candidatus Merdinaster equi]
MSKSLYIAEKPSVARSFAENLGIKGKSADGYIESEEAIVTWCVGHLVTMCYPDAYDEKLKRWSMDTLPFVPDTYKYQVIDDVKKQFGIVSGLLLREDVSTIYVCTDSGREGEYIYRLVEQMSGVLEKNKIRKRVWINSQTKEEIIRGVKEAKDLSEYDCLSSAAYLRAKEDYLMGINFTRALTLKYGPQVKNFLKADKAVVTVGRVMTCVLGMVVSREREIRSFVKTPFFRVIGSFELSGSTFDGEWKENEKSKYHDSPLLYKENGFKKEESARELIDYLASDNTATVQKIERKKEVKNAPLLYNLAELQNDCSKYFKISPDQTLNYIQDMYEKKLLTYPRTDARVLSSAVAKEINKNVQGLMNGYPMTSSFCKWILEKGAYKGLEKTRYVNDKQITDHYAIIPTGQGFSALSSLDATETKIFEIVVRRFLSIFCPPAQYEKVSLVLEMKGTESFYSNFKVLKEEGFLKCAAFSFAKKNAEAVTDKKDNNKDQNDNKSEESQEDIKCDENFLEEIARLKKGDAVSVSGMSIKEGETSPPKRYNSGSMILAMENAGQLIEDEDLRAQIKGSGIGTSATRGEILKKLFTIKYLNNNKKTQIITPTLLGEMIYDVVECSMKALLDPALTASWEKGLTGVAEGTISESEYMDKLKGFVERRTNVVKTLDNQGLLNSKFQSAAQFYKTKSK